MNNDNKHTDRQTDRQTAKSNFRLKTSSIRTAVDSYEAVRDICKPLFAIFNLNFFRYLRIYPDNTRIHLCSNPNWTDHFYNGGLHKIAWFDCNQLHTPQNQEILWDIKAGSDDNKVGVEARNHYDMHHGMSVIRKQPLYYEVYDFATTKSNTRINELYLANITIFERFFFYFKEQAQKIIRISEEDKLIFPPEPAPILIKENATSYENFINNTATRRYYINTQHGDIYLTAKECECAYWTYLGKTAEETGIITQCAQRTAELHLTNVKRKLQTNKISHALKIIADSGAFEALKYSLRSEHDLF